MKFSVFLFIVFSFCYADKVILINGNEINGRIIKETSSYIVIILEGSKNRIQIEKDQIVDGGIILSKEKTLIDPTETPDLTDSLKLTLVLQKETAVYEVGEPIRLRFQIENNHTDTIKIRRAIYSRSRVLHDKAVLISFLALSDIIQIKNIKKNTNLNPEPIYDQFPSSFRVFSIPPKSQYREPAALSAEGENEEVLEVVFDLQQRFLLEPGKYQIRGYYKNNSDKEGIWAGKLFSDPINIEIVPNSGKRQTEVPLNQQLEQELKEVKAIYDRKEWDKTIATIDQLESRFFDTYELNYWRGRVYLAKGNYEESQRYFRQSIAQNSEYWIASFELGIAYLKGRRFQDAYQTIQQIPDKQKNSNHYWLMASIYQNGLLDYEEAAKMYKEFKQAGGDNKEYEERKQQVSSEEKYAAYLTEEVKEFIRIINDDQIPTDFAFRSKVQSFLEGEEEYKRLDYLKDLYLVSGDVIYKRYLLIRR